MNKKLDIGIASYRNPEKLKRCLDSITEHTRTPFKLHIWHNTTEDAENDAALRVLDTIKCERTVSANVGYAGAVNGLIAQSNAPYFAYFDNDTEVQTPGWDERFIEVLENNPECGQVFPGAGHFGFHNGRYHECLWSAGYCWMLRRTIIEKLLGRRRHGNGDGWMDITLGHHEEVDLMIRLRLAGFQIGCVPDVQVKHHETATSSPESAKRIHMGVVRFMNKWNRYFVGDAIRYPNPDPDSGEGYDPRCLRYTRWPPNALYIERWVLSQFPGLNANPEVLQTSSGPMDVIKVLREKGYYHERSI